MNRKLNIDDLKLMVKDCVYEEENIVCMNNQYYRKLTKKINNLQSKIDKAIILIDNYLEMVDNPDINMQCVKDILKKED